MIRVDTVEPPTLIAYRAAHSATWHVPTQIEPGKFAFAVDGPYIVTVVCDELANGFVSVRQLARTPADDRSLELACDTVPSPYHVTGTMVQPGLVRIGTNAAYSRTTPTWQFDVTADRGSHALVATTTDQIAIRRDIAVCGDTTIEPPIDVTVEGAALQPVTLTPTNLDGTETELTGIVVLDVGDTRELRASALADTRVVPNAVLRPHDVQTVTVTVHNPTVGRTVTRRFRAGDPTTFPLPEPMGPVAFDGLSVAWSTLPAQLDTFEVSFDALSFETFTLQFHQLELTAAFMQATDAVDATLDASAILGFSPAWQIDLTQPYHRFAGVSRALPNGDVVGSDVSESVEP